MRYYTWNGMEKTEIKADAVGAIDDEGNNYELHWRTTDKEMSLNVERGRLVISPVASNAVRVSAKK